jgi:O-Antigen ligase
MSTQPATSTSSAASQAYSRMRARGKASISGLTLNGVLLFVVSILVLASGYASMRPKVMGLSLHPYLVPLALAFPFVMLARLGQFPAHVLAALLVFTGMYSFSVLGGKGIALGEIFKMCSGVATLVICALLVRRRGDFVAGALGLSIAIALLAVRGLQEDKFAGVEVMEGANKNSYSLFALPAMLMAGYITTRMRKVSVFIKGLLIACTVPALAATFLSANRSGYLGAVVIGFMLFWDRRGRGMLIVGAVAGGMVIWMANFADTRVFDERMKQTMEGNDSDDTRVAILGACLQIVSENPILGVSPSEVGFEIGRRVQVGHGHHLNYLDSHNVFAHIIAASGLICFVGLLAMGYTLWNLKPADGRKFTGQDDPARHALTLMRMMLALWVVRGMFTREILYNPACNIALGLCIGLFIASQSIPHDPEDAQDKSAPGRLPAPGRSPEGAT